MKGMFYDAETNATKEENVEAQKSYLYRLLHNPDTNYTDRLTGPHNNTVL